jgi:tRNA threonylcarbamoyladenosine modification (KEOPS) complex  Pcc1 subunit
MQAGAANKPYQCTLRIKLQNERHAMIIKDCMEVDEELQPLKVSKQFTITDNTLTLEIAATELRMLRVALSSFFDMVTVSVKTILEFDV